MADNSRQYIGWLFLRTRCLLEEVRSGNARRVICLHKSLAFLLSIPVINDAGTWPRDGGWLWTIRGTLLVWWRVVLISFPAQALHRQPAGPSAPAVFQTAVALRVCRSAGPARAGG